MATYHDMCTQILPDQATFLLFAESGLMCVYTKQLAHASVIDTHTRTHTHAHTPHTNAHTHTFKLMHTHTNTTHNLYQLLIS